MKSVALHTHCLIAPRYREKACDARQIAVKCRVEARNLRRAGKTLLQRFYHFEFSRQVRRRQRSEAPQLLQNTRSETLKRCISPPPVHDSMADRADGRGSDSRVQQIADQ